jgi:hypothetical protein
MSALYAMRYIGRTGMGDGVLYIGRGKVVGADAGNGRYHGTYADAAGRVKAEITMSFPKSAGVLVTGQPMPVGSSLKMTADWPANFTDGSPQTIMVNGSPVSVTFEKIGDVP